MRLCKQKCIHHRMNRLVTYLILTFFLCSCQSESTTSDSTESIADIDAFQSYSIDINSPRTKVTSQIASVEIARLEETNESLLKAVQQIFEFQDNLIFYNQDSGDIFIFNQEGNFKNKINRSGNGPEEYGQITDLWLEGDTIAIHNRSTRNIKKYSFEGNFIESIRLPAQVNHINNSKNGYVFGTHYTPFQDSLRYQWGVWNDKLELIEKYQPFGISADNNIDVDYSLNTILPYEKDRSLFRIHSDTIYLLRNSVINPLIHFDFGEDWFWTDRTSPEGQDLNEVEGSDQVWYNYANIGAEIIYLRSVVDYKGWEHFIINRQNKKVIRLDIRRTLEELFTLFPLLWQEDLLLCSLPSSEVAEFINQVGTENIQYKQGSSLDIIESSENPVLLWVKFKKNQL